MDANAASYARDTLARCRRGGRRRRENREADLDLASDCRSRSTAVKPLARLARCARALRVTAAPRYPRLTAKRSGSDKVWPPAPARVSWPILFWASLPA